MIIDFLSKFFRKDVFLKRNIIKTVSWSITGFTSIVVLYALMNAAFFGGVVKYLIVILITSVFYYCHERLWQQNNWAALSKRRQVQMVQMKIKPNLFRQMGKITRQDREKLNHNKSFTLWLTGLSGAGKSTLATEIEEWIHQQNGRVYIIDGDNTRLSINSDLTFSDDDRTENIRRVAEICRLFNDAGIIVIASFISPFIANRSLAREIIGEESFVETYLEASVSVCQKRDKKGLYDKALAGEIKNFTGVNSPYEAPVSPDLHLNTAVMSIEDCVAILKKYIAENRFEPQIASRLIFN